jgi:indolepyruvate ferredoxin oxidoreductase beta subunit
MVLRAPHVAARGETAVETEVEIELKIEAAWCKGCDICVKLCPERCLALDPATQVAVLAKPEACTGCRICEWLCPDFAIEVRRHEVARSQPA